MHHANGVKVLQARLHKENKSRNLQCRSTSVLQYAALLNQGLRHGERASILYKNPIYKTNLRLLSLAICQTPADIAHLPKPLLRFLVEGSSIATRIAFGICHMFQKVNNKLVIWLERSIAVISEEGYQYMVWFVVFPYILVGFLWVHNLPRPEPIAGHFGEHYVPFLLPHDTPLQPAPYAADLTVFPSPNC